ncbi:TEDC2 protein, partial [Odontophorus gujanensis]|nr:TEDC2 protein [Odontophorus gujanensis]
TPSPRELRELELLNAALEKALRVRKSVSRASAAAQGAAGEKAPGAAGKSSSKAVASKRGRSCEAAVHAAAEPQRAAGFPMSASSGQHGFPVAERSPVDVCRQQLCAGKESCGSLGADEPSAAAGSASPWAAPLWEQGCQLELPLSYRKAHSRNSRAWEKCRLCHTSADAAAARMRFTERIQSTFCSPMPTLSPAEIEEELTALQDVPSRLSLYVETESADHPTLQREYESLLTLEGLQSTASQCLHKLQLLRADCTGDRAHCCAAHAAAGARVCSSVGMLAAPLLCYSGLQELSNLFALKLRVSMLHQEIALQKLTMTELLPVLDSRPCPGTSVAQLYRAIYTQLCEGGGRFPVLVRDELTD